MDRILSRQHVRQALRCEVQSQGTGVVIRPWLDAEGRRRLEESYFGLRLLATTRDEWTRAQRAGYRGGLRGLVRRLGKIRTVLVAEQLSGCGCPQIHQQTESCDEALLRLGQMLGALPK